MTRNIIIAVAALSLALGAAPAWAKTVQTVTPSELGSYCDQSQTPGNATVLLDTGNGNPVSVTIHCGGSTTTTVGDNTDSGESEQGPAEAAENGVED
jgi:hypothetical protein